MYELINPFIRKVALGNSALTSSYLTSSLRCFVCVGVFRSSGVGQAFAKLFTRRCELNYVNILAFHNSKIYSPLKILLQPEFSPFRTQHFCGSLRLWIHNSEIMFPVPPNGKCLCLAADAYYDRSGKFVPVWKRRTVLKWGHCAGRKLASLQCKALLFYNSYGSTSVARVYLMALPNTRGLRRFSREKSGCCSRRCHIIESVKCALFHCNILYGSFVNFFLLFQTKLHTKCCNWSYSSGSVKTTFTGNDFDEAWI